MLPWSQPHPHAPPLSPTHSRKVPHEQCARLSSHYQGPPIWEELTWPYVIVAQAVQGMDRGLEGVTGSTSAVVDEVPDLHATLWERMRHDKELVTNAR